MGFELQLSWKESIILHDNSPQYNLDNKMFNILTSKGFIRDIGGINSTNIDPIVLSPTVAFHHSLRNVLRENNFEGIKFPYVCSDGNELNIKFHLYLNKILILDINLKNTIDVELDNIIEKQNIRNHKEIYALVEVITSLVLYGKQKNYYLQNKIKIYPNIIVFSNISESLDISEKKAVEILIRHNDAKDDIIKDVIKKNSTHQLNSSYVLADKQGVICTVPFHLYTDKEVKKKYKSVRHLSEFAIILFNLLNLSDLIIFKKNREAIKLLLFNPNLLFIHSVTALRTWEFLVDEFDLKIFYEQKNDQLSKTFPIKVLKTLKNKKLYLSLIFPLLIYIYKSTNLEVLVKSFLSSLGS